MRKVSDDAANAFISNMKYKSKNTEVVPGVECKMYLFGNLIAKKDANGIMITTCGYNTRTTKDRLNAIPGVKVFTENYTLFLNDKYWDGSWILV